MSTRRSCPIVGRGARGRDRESEGVIDVAVESGE